MLKISKLLLLLLFLISCDNIQNQNPNVSGIRYGGVLTYESQNENGGLSDGDSSSSPASTQPWPKAGK